MKKPLTFKKLKDLAAIHPPREQFGPRSDMPYIAFDLDGSSAQLAPWLKDLPCPVIGIGEGPLNSACDVVLKTDKKLPILAKNIKYAPIAAMSLVQHLRASEMLSLQDALTAESFAYSTLQTGPEFKAWLSGFEKQTLNVGNEPLVSVHRDAKNTMCLTLKSAVTRNAIGVDMRDALCTLLDLAMTEPDIQSIHLTGDGATFSTGGAIEEFGEVPDPATAHWVRSLRLPAWRLARLSDKLGVHVNGAAIGAGVELAAFGHHVTASSKAWFQLPELKYGLIPGAGGTASIPRRIGRQKTAYMALSMEKVRSEKALKWGLIDAITD